MHEHKAAFRKNLVGTCLILADQNFLLAVEVSLI